jgi:muramoyltetrapeptide carboxypeptidase LdcA involved in peptidoglycan recycling
MNTLYPESLKRGDEIRVIAPSLSMEILSQETIQYALERFKEMGFILSFGKHVHEIDQLQSSSIESRIADLHEAFENPSVKAIVTAIGGYNCNQLLEYIDWSVIQNNPKIICGYSDITILLNAIFSKTGLVTYYGPHFSTFGQKIFDTYTTDYFLSALTQQKPFAINPSHQWSDDLWYMDQDKRELKENEGYWIMQEGRASGTAIGGHLGTFCLLQGTAYMPSLKGSILIIEEDAEPANPAEFDRRLQSILQQPHAESIAGILIGRFQQSYGMSRDLLAHIIKSKKIVRNKPIIANVDFGHTEPHCTLPIGGMIEIVAQNNTVVLNLPRD